MTLIILAALLIMLLTVFGYAAIAYLFPKQ